MAKFFFSDPHAYHKNIVRGLTSWDVSTSLVRPFNTMDEMMNTMIDNINSAVGQNDELFCLGDWNFGDIDNINKFREQINCNKIYLICGNHDNCHGQTWDPYIKSIKRNASELFVKYTQYHELYVGDTLLVLFHYPLASWNEMRKESIMLHGHTHRSPQDRFINGGKSMDVGLDGHPEFRPYHMDEIFEIMSSRSVITEGHH